MCPGTRRWSSSSAPTASDTCSKEMWCAWASRRSSPGSNAGAGDRCATGAENFLILGCRSWLWPSLGRVRQERHYPRGQSGRQSRQRRTDLLGTIALREVRQHDGLVAKLIGALDEVVQVKVSITARPVEILRQKKGALDQKHPRGKESRGRLEDLDAAVAGIGQQRDLFHARDVDPPAAKRGDLGARQIVELRLELGTHLGEDVADGGYAMTAGQKFDLEIAPERERFSDARRDEVEPVRHVLEPLAGGRPLADVVYRGFRDEDSSRRQTRESPP